MTMSRDNRELLRVGLVGVGPGSTLSDRILLTLLDDLDALERERNDLVARYETQIVEVARRAYDQRDAAQDVLRQVEWRGRACLDWDYWKPACPMCSGVCPAEWDPLHDDSLDEVRSGRVSKGHAPDCRIAAALDGKPAGSDPRNGTGGSA